MGPKSARGLEFFEWPLVGQQSKIGFFVFFYFFPIFGFPMTEITIRTTAIIKPSRKMTILPGKPEIAGRIWSLLKIRIPNFVGKFCRHGDKTWKERLNPSLVDIFGFARVDWPKGDLKVTFGSVFEIWPHLDSKSGQNREFRFFTFFFKFGYVNVQITIPLTTVIASL